MKFIALFFTIVCITAFADEYSAVNRPIVKRNSIVTASTAPIIEYSNGILSVETASTASKVTVTIVDESGTTIYRRTNPLSSTSHSFSVMLLPGEVYTITATINGTQHTDIIIL